MNKLTLLFYFIFTFLIASRSFGQQGKAVAIGSQTWDTKNLYVTSFTNGDKIEQAQSTDEWIKAGKESKPAWCYYENDTDKGQTHGLMYNFYAVLLFQQTPWRKHDK